MARMVRKLSVFGYYHRILRHNISEGGSSETIVPWNFDNCVEKTIKLNDYLLNWGEIVGQSNNISLWGSSKQIIGDVVKCQWNLPKINKTCVTISFQNIEKLQIWTTVEVGGGQILETFNHCHKRCREKTASEEACIAEDSDDIFFLHSSLEVKINEWLICQNSRNLTRLFYFCFKEAKCDEFFDQVFLVTCFYRRSRKWTKGYQIKSANHCFSVRFLRISDVQTCCVCLRNAIAAKIPLPTLEIEQQRCLKKEY